MAKTAYGRKNAAWVAIIGAVSSVFGRTGAVVAQAGDYDVAKITGAAPLASPVFTGDPRAPTPAVDDNDTSLATTAFVLAQASGANPTMAGVAAPGASLRWARGDHVHPTDTSRAAVIAVRERLTSNRVYGVSSSAGNDANSGQANSHTSTVTFTNGSANIGWPSNLPSVGELVYFVSSAGLPTNFNQWSGYYVLTASAGVVTVSRTPSGAAVVAGSAGSGVHAGQGLSPFATLQKCMDVIAALDMGIFSVQVAVGAGSYTTLVLKQCLGAGSVSFYADRTVYPTLCQCFVTSTNYPVSTPLGVTTNFNLYGFNVASSGFNDMNFPSGGIYLYDIEWAGNVPGNHRLWVSQNSVVSLQGNHKVMSNGASWLLADAGAKLYADSFNVDITQNVTFTQFAYSRNNSYFESAGAVFNLHGFTVTGTRWAASNCSGFNGTGGVTGYFPGTVNGSLTDPTCYYK